MCSPHYLPAVCQPLGHYEGMSHINMAELDSLSWGNSWTGLHRLPAAVDFLSRYWQVPKACLLLSRPGRDQYSCAGKKRFSSSKQPCGMCMRRRKEAFQRQGGNRWRNHHRERRSLTLPSSRGRKVAELRLSQVTPTPSANSKCHRDI